MAQPIGLSDRLIWLEAQLDDYLEDQIDEIAEHEERELAEAIVRFVLWRIVYRRLEGRVQMGGWLEAPFPEEEQGEEARGG